MPPPGTGPHTSPPVPPLAVLARDLRATGLPQRLFALARDEDLGPGLLDVTAHVCQSDGGDATFHARVIARSTGVAAGLAFVPDLLEAFASAAPALLATPLANDGERLLPGQPLLHLRGPAASVVVVERTLLNLLARLSGVATLTDAFAAAARFGAAAASLPPPLVLDTRKTTPGLRTLEKYAVACGGGTPHRMGLHDAVLIKDNHLAAAGVAADPARLQHWLAHAAARARALRPAPAFIEVEVDTLEQFEALLTLPAGTVDIALLDNMPPRTMLEAARRRNTRAPALRLEASGGVSLATIADIAATGVDRISVGRLTHHAVSLDLGLDEAPAANPDPAQPSALSPS